MLAQKVLCLFNILTNTTSSISLSNLKEEVILETLKIQLILFPFVIFNNNNNLKLFLSLFTKFFKTIIKN